MEKLLGIENEYLQLLIVILFALVLFGVIRYAWLYYIYWIRRPKIKPDNDEIEEVR